MGGKAIAVTDEELLVRAQGDDALAFAELYGRLEDALRIGRCGSSTTARSIPSG